MPTTNYHTVNGMVIGETRDGVRRAYLREAKGSVVATVNADGEVENTYRYKPFGGLLAKTGDGPDPRFLFLGSLGFQTNPTRYAELYYAHFVYSTEAGRWNQLLTIGRFRFGYRFGTHRQFSLGPVAMAAGRHAAKGALFRNCAAAFDQECEGRTPIVIGPGKPPKDTPPRCFGSGYTNCDEDSGKPYSIVCDKCPCTVTCTIAHETAHHPQIAGCCSLYKTCMDRAGSNLIDQTKCREAYLKWTGDDNNVAVWECAAYKASAKCFQAFYALLCGAVCVDPKCCADIKRNLEVDTKNRDACCKAAAGKTVKACPFNEDGSIKK